MAHRSLGSPITIALVNNMPDGAFLDTEHQFRRAVTAGGQTDADALSLYAMPGLHRSDEVTAEIRSRYLGIEQLEENPPGCLIVTGTEPAQAQLPYEAYWPHLSRLLQWAADAVPTTLLSCLAAHASLLIFDGIEREPLAAKCCGVFGGEASEAPLANRLPKTAPVPHSRINDVPERALVEAGYRIVVGSGGSGAGWSIAAREQGAGTFVLCQGHPEYSTESLLREYRRDVRRFLFGRGGFAYPALPEGYFDPQGIAVLEAFRERAMTPGTDPLQLYENFPYEELEADLSNTWADTSATFYFNWLGLAGHRAAAES
jgi:homoserine O-succinyltransferase/O-acetyltransferase